MTAERPHTVHSPLHRRLAAWVGLPLGGLALGGAVATLIDFTARGVLHEVTTLAPDPLRLTVGAAIGLAVGLLLAVGYVSERLRARIGDDVIELAWDQVHATAPRHTVAAVVADGDVVVLARDGTELVRVAGQLDVAQLQGALDAHGYPSLVRSDPNEASFVEWTDGDHRLSDTIHRYIAAYGSSVSAHALMDAEHLRRALVAQGVAVRARRGRVEWRQLATSRRAVAA